MINNKCTYSGSICIFSIALFLASLFCDGLWAADSVSAGYSLKSERDGIIFEVRTDRSELSIADTIEFTISATFPDNIKIVLPQLQDLLKGSDSFGLLDSEKPVTKLISNNISNTYIKSRIEPFVTGQAVFPNLTLEYYHKVQGQSQPEVKSLTIAGPDFIIKDLISTNGQLNDIKGPIAIPVSYSWMFWLALAVFLLVILLLIIVYLASKRQLSAPAIQQRPAHEIALERLNALIAENLLQQGKIKEFYEKLSYIIRLYIEHRYSLKAPERTTEEFLQEASANPDMPDAFKDRLKEFLMHCDMVKFAKYAPTSDEITRSVDLARNFIESTATLS